MLADSIRSAVPLALLAALGAGSCVAAVACSQPSRAPQPGDLMVLDADAGTPLAAGGARRGELFKVPQEADGRYGAPQVYAADERWIEPVDVLLLPGGDALVLEQQWSPEPPPALGAVFLVRAPQPGPNPSARGSVQLLLADARMRQPVSMTRGPDGTLWVSDRAADPLGLGQDTGCVFAFPPVTKTATPLPGTPGTIAAAGPELLTPGALLRCSDGRLLLMDADANPRHLLTSDGRPATPGVLFEVTPDGLKELLEPDDTVSPIALIERPPGEIYLVDANAGTQPGMLGDGAIFRLVEQDGRRWLSRRVDSAMLGKAHLLVDPVNGDTLPDGRLIVADANADPLGLGEKGGGFGVYGKGHGAVLAIEVDGKPSVTSLVADPAFVTPIAVRRVR